ncbi:MAG: DnaJ domain-containing protein [Phycisphaerales bacterium]|jgi:DnaJ-domain-containing protein 1
MPNAFEILGLPPAFDVEPARIERAYLRQVASLHPDSSDGDDGDDAKAAALNKARATLLNPERRAQELLAVLGGTPGVAPGALPGGFLMSIMETREEVEAALASGDAAARAKWLAWATTERAAYIASAAGLFSKAAADPSASRQQLRETLNAWRYIERLAEQLDPAYDHGSEGV